MLSPGQAVLLRIYTDEDALHGDQSLVDLIVRKARQAGLAGATVLRGRLGFGQASHLHVHRPFGLDDNLPVVIELVDQEPALRAFVGELDGFGDIGLITFEKVEVARYGHPSP
ncbi:MULTISPECIES: DUF190 domain-containing protein [unclassified Phenylobacterium]|uniref:DUF190 domain-containing protein n=1 Tax=unclassified Phenylobacterium TaxID=2640670 RepID=UPI00083A7545|nr:MULTISPECIES: DUF190 domain-containing protein [unclassified Phenylobacterium]